MNRESLSAMVWASGAMVVATLAACDKAPEAARAAPPAPAPAAVAAATPSENAKPDQPSSATATAGAKVATAVPQRAGAALPPCDGPAPDVVEVTDLETGGEVDKDKVLRLQGSKYVWSETGREAKDCSVEKTRGRLMRVRIPERKDTLKVSVVDLQVWAPKSVSRVLLGGAQEYGKGNNWWSFGAVLELENASVHVLRGASLTGTLAVSRNGEPDAEVVKECEVRVDEYYFASADPKSKTGWTTERKWPEAYWRPQEKVRVALTGSCLQHDIQDAGIDSLAFSAVVGASHLYGEGDEMGVLADIPLSADLLTAQRFTGSSGTGIVHGDILVSIDSAGELSVSSSSWSAPLTAQKREPVPQQFEAVSSQLDELKVQFTQVARQAWLDVPGTSKGLKTITLQGTQSIDSASITARLQAAVDAAEVALKEKTRTAEEANRAAEAATAAAKEDESKAADAKAATAAAKAANAAASAAQKSLDAAKKKKDSSLASERKRLGTALNCGAVTLVTSTSWRKIVNAADVKTACGALLTGDKTDVTWKWQLDRYEIPLAVVAEVGAKTVMVPVATQDTIKNDRR